ncbi:MAG: DNA-binding NarL/FixJ family response regulator [Bacteroidia bacterium]
MFNLCALPKTHNKLIVVDDHQIVLDGLTILLEKIENVTVLKGFTKPKEALTFLEYNDVDIVITDLSMPEMSGLELTQRIKAGNTKTKVIALTMHNDVKSIKSMAQLGADGYILKNTDFDVLKTALETVLSGQQYFGTEILEAIVNDFKPSVELDGRKINLSMRELGILELIATGMTTDSIAEQLFISKHTVNSHRRNLNVKLSVSRPAELVSKAKSLGLI